VYEVKYIYSLHTYIDCVPSLETTVKVE